VPKPTAAQRNNFEFCGEGLSMNLKSHMNNCVPIDAYAAFWAIVRCFGKLASHSLAGTCNCAYVCRGNVGFGVRE